jgi:Sigma-70 region 2
VELISSAASGEGELVERYNRGVRFFIRREVGDAAIADDLYQETFCLILKNIRRERSDFCCAMKFRGAWRHFIPGLNSLAEETQSIAVQKIDGTFVYRRTQHCRPLPLGQAIP